MSLDTIPHTLAIFDRLYQEVPPLTPTQLVDDMRQGREQMKLNYSLSLVDLEDTIIAFGKKLWPYRKAFDEFFDIYEGKLGETFLLTHLSPAMKRRYEEYKAYGGDYRSFHRGAPATFFTPEERNMLCEALVAVNQDILAHATQAVMSVDRERYEKRIVEFHVILDDIEKRLDTLRHMADDEQEHPELAAEIRAEIQSFEYGLCLLGPAHSYEAVCNAEEHFHGRKLEKKMRA